MTDSNQNANALGSQTVLHPNRAVGIIGYGAYVPRYRLPGSEVARVWTNGLGGSPIKEKAVAGLDEDVITMSIEAARNALARAMFFHRLGELCDRSFESQLYRASGLNLLVAAIILWNTRYLETAVETLRAAGRPVPDDLLRHVAPLGWEHVSPPMTIPGIAQTNPTVANSDRSATHPPCSLPSSPDVLV